MNGLSAGGIGAILSHPITVSTFREIKKAGSSVEVGWLIETRGKTVEIEERDRVGGGVEILTGSRDGRGWPIGCQHGRWNGRCGEAE